jgi:hypothetical protein
MKKILIILGILVVVVIVSVLIIVQVVVPGLIIKEIQAKTNNKVKIDSLSLGLLASTINVKGVVIDQTPDTSVRIQEVQADISLASLLGGNIEAEALLSNLAVSAPKQTKVQMKQIMAQVDVAMGETSEIEFNVLLDEPNISVTLTDPDEEEPPPPPPALEPKGKFELDKFEHLVKGKFRLQKGRIEVKTLNPQGTPTPLIVIDGFSVDIETADIRKGIQLTTQKSLQFTDQTNYLKTPISTRFNIGVASQRAKITSGVIDIGGLKINLSSESALDGQSASWNIAIDSKELKELDLETNFFKKGDIQGAINAQIQGQFNKDSGVTTNGKILAPNLAISVKLDQADTKIQGYALVNTETQFEIVNNEPQTLSTQTSVDLTNLYIQQGNLFIKPHKVPLSFMASASIKDKVVQVENAGFKLAKLNLSAIGSANLKNPKAPMINFSLKLPKTSLTGLEKMVLPLKQYPLRGSIQANATIKGNASNPESLYLKLSPVEIRGLSGRFAWKDKDKQISGPVQANAVASITAQGKDLKAANVNMQVNLSGMRILFADKLRKPAKSPLKLNLVARKKGNQIFVQKSTLVTGAGNISLTGNVKSPQRPNFNLKLNTSKISFSKLTGLVPMLKKFKLSGHSKLSVATRGTYDFKKGIEKSPISVSGKATVVVPKFAYKLPEKKKDAKEPEKPEEETPVDPGPLAPNWPIIRNANLSLDAKLGLLDLHKTKISKIHLKGRFKKGVVSGKLNIGRVFRGSARVSRVSLSVLKKSPPLKFKAGIKNINLADSFNFLMPDWKGLIEGIATGQVSGTFEHPSLKDYLKKSNIKGGLNILNAKVDSLQFDKKINDNLKKVPGLGQNKSVKLVKSKAKLATNFHLREGICHMENFDLHFVDNNQFVAKGKVFLNKKLDMDATAYLIDSPVKGSVKAANSDKQGRLVVPVKVKGSVFSPDVQVLDSTLQKMAKKTAEYEAKKATKKLEKKAKKEIEKAGKDLLNNLLKK